MKTIEVSASDLLNLIAAGQMIDRQKYWLYDIQEYLEALEKVAGQAAFICFLHINDPRIEELKEKLVDVGYELGECGTHD